LNLLAYERAGGSNCDHDCGDEGFHYAKIVLKF